MPFELEKPAVEKPRQAVFGSIYACFMTYVRSRCGKRAVGFKKHVAAAGGYGCRLNAKSYCGGCRVKGQGKLCLTIGG
jgi:hypothetical protein